MYVYHVSLVSRPPSMGLKRVTQKNLSQHSFKRPRKLLGCWQILPKTHHLQLIGRLIGKKTNGHPFNHLGPHGFFWHQGTKDHVGLTSIALNPELIELTVRAWKWMVGIRVSSWDGLIFSGVICMLVLGSVIPKYQVLCIPTIYHFGNVGLLFRKCIFPARGRSDENPLTWSHLDLGSDTMTTRRITLLLCLDNEYLGRKICPKVWSSNTADASEKPTLTT